MKTLSSTDSLVLTQLEKSDPAKAQALTSEAALRTYTLGVPFAELANLELAKMQILTSWDMLDAYNAGVNFADLANLEPAKIKALTSWLTLQSYKAKTTTFTELAKLDPEQIYKAIFLAKQKPYELAPLNLADSSAPIQLETLELAKLEVLASKGVARAYKLAIPFVELVKLEPEQIKALTSVRAIMAYKAGVAFTQLASLEPANFELLTSWNAIEVYESGLITFAKLASVGLDKGKTLITQSALASYKVGAPFTELAKLEPGQIKELTSWATLNAYTLGIPFTELVNLEPAKIEALTLPSMIDAYKAGVPFSGLVDLELVKIKALTSWPSLMSYKAGTATFAELATLEPEQIYKRVFLHKLNSYESNPKALKAAEQDYRALIADRKAKLANENDSAPAKLEPEQIISELAVASETAIETPRTGVIFDAQPDFLVPDHAYAH